MGGTMFLPPRVWGALPPALGEYCHTLGVGHSAKGVVNEGKPFLDLLVSCSSLDTLPAVQQRLTGEDGLPATSEIEQ